MDTFSTAPYETPPMFLPCIRQLGLIALLVKAVIIVSFSSASADWIDDALRKEMVRLYGNPSITLHASEGVSITLPSETLATALRSGLTTRQAVAQFLGRFGPKHCSDVIDMNIPHPNMKVEVRILQEKPLRLSERLAGLRKAFEVRVDEAATEVMIDYVPEKTAKCVSPSAEAF